MPTDRWLAVLILYQAQFIRHLRYCFYFYIYGILKEVNVFISNSVRDVIVYYLLAIFRFLEEIPNALVIVSKTSIKFVLTFYLAI